LLGDKNPFCAGAVRKNGREVQQKRENNSSYCILSDNNQSFRIKSIESVGWHSLAYTCTGGNAHQTETPDRNALDKRIIMVIEYFLNLKIDCARDLKMAESFLGSIDKVIVG
jgi:hypothetical protein